MITFYVKILNGDLIQIQQESPSFDKKEILDQIEFIKNKYKYNKYHKYHFFLDRLDREDKELRKEDKIEDDDIVFLFIDKISTPSVTIYQRFERISIKFEQKNCCCYEASLSYGCEEERERMNFVFYCYYDETTGIKQKKYILAKDVSILSTTRTVNSSTHIKKYITHTLTFNNNNKIYSDCLEMVKDLPEMINFNECIPLFQQKWINQIIKRDDEDSIFKRNLENFER